jgi:hypothetical protein
MRQYYNPRVLLEPPRRETEDTEAGCISVQRRRKPLVEVYQTGVAELLP